MTHGQNEKDFSSLRLSRRISTIRELSVDYEGYSETIATRPPDISTRGMFINTNRTFPEGAVLNVQFCLAFSGVEIRSRAEVRYCLEGVGVGVEFVEISPEAVAAIEKEIAFGSGESPAVKAQVRK
jgi:PilZ domain